MRTYEARSAAALERKMAMFNEACAAFGASPDWRRIDSDPKYAAIGSESVIHAVFLRLAPCSQIR